MFQNLSITEVVIILVILMVAFGTKKIVDLAQGAGEATKEFKNIKNDIKKTVKEVTDLEPISDTKLKKGGDSHA